MILGCLDVTPFMPYLVLFMFFVDGCLLFVVEQEDDDARAIVKESLINDGMDLLFNLKFIRVEHDLPANEDDFPTIRVVVEQNGVEKVR